MAWPLILGKIGTAILGGVTGGISAGIGARIGARLAGDRGREAAYAQAGPEQAALYHQAAFATAADQQAQASAREGRSDWLEAQRDMAQFQAELQDKATDKAFWLNMASREQEFRQALIMNALTDRQALNRLRVASELDRARIPAPDTRSGVGQLGTGVRNFFMGERFGDEPWENTLRKAWEGLGDTAYRGWFGAGTRAFQGE